MKLADPDNPVRSSWFADQGYRLSPGPYVSDGYAARKFLERFPHTDTLADVTGGRIFRPGIFRRHWTTDPEYGIPFLSSADIFQSDLSSLAMITKKSFTEIPRLALEPGWTLVTCSGMTAGRVTYARLDMDGYACSQDVIRAAPDPDRIPAGYLYTFLSSRYGTPMIRGTVYGTSVKHIEPPHLADLPVPRIGDELEQEIDSLFQKAMTLRAKFQTGITSATRDLFESAGLPDLADYNWQRTTRARTFETRMITAQSIRALNYEPESQSIMATLRATPHATLGDICVGGMLDTGPRFKRIDVGAETGVRLLGQRQAFWMRPEGRWISPNHTPNGVFVPDETVMIAEHGLIGETALICRSMLVHGPWSNYAYTQDLLRVIPGRKDISGSYLFAFLRSEPAFRILRSMLVGTGPQEIHPTLRAQLPVPLLGREDQLHVEALIREAFRSRDEADELEDRAQELLDAGIQAMTR